MAIEFKLPDLGENIESADVLEVLVQPGDTVEKDQTIIEIETDKATIEVPATSAGKVKEVKVKAGDKINVGHVIILFEDIHGESKPEKEVKKKEEQVKETKKESKEEKISEVKKEKKSVTKPGGIVEVKLPELGENIESADILAVLIEPGSTIEKDQSIIEIETDKATIEVPTPISGKVTEVLVKAGDKAKVHQVIIKVEASTEVVEESLTKEKTVEEEETGKDLSDEKDKTSEDEVDETPSEFSEISFNKEYKPLEGSNAPAAPSVRRLARELGVDINKIKGSGSGSRISMNDVKTYVKELNESGNSGAGVFASGIKEEPLPDFSKFGKTETEEMTNIRAKTAEHLSYAWATIPHVTQFDKADITELEKTRKAFSNVVEKEGSKLTVTAILIKIIASALKNYPQFNASVDMKNKTIIYKQYYNIGVAVDTERGLIVPVIRNADKKNIIEISQALTEISEKARNRKIGLEDLQGGSFTISNLGGIGGTYFTPIVNTPEAAILGVSRGSYEPVFNKEKGAFEPRLMLPLSLSYDHRIIDGADAIRFLRWIIEALEQPMKLLIEG